MNDPDVKIKTEQVERLTLEFPADKRTEVLDWLYENGYTLSGRCGPKPVGVGRVDPDVQLFIAERNRDA